MNVIRRGRLDAANPITAFPEKRRDRGYIALRDVAQAVEQGDAAKARQRRVELDDLARGEGRLVAEINRCLPLSRYASYGKRRNGFPPEPLSARK